GGAPGSDGGQDALSPYPAAVLSDHPIAYFRFGERTGSVAIDQVSSHHGSYPGAGIQLGVQGALGNDGDTDVRIAGPGRGRIIVPGTVAGSDLSQYSVEVWVQRASSNQPNAFVVDNESYDPRTGWDLIVGSDGVFFERWNGAAHLSANASVLTVGEWHHL